MLWSWTAVAIRRAFRLAMDCKGAVWNPDFPIHPSELHFRVDFLGLGEIRSTLVSWLFAAPGALPARNGAQLGILEGCLRLLHGRALSWLGGALVAPSSCGVARQIPSLCI